MEVDPAPLRSTTGGLSLIRKTDTIEMQDTVSPSPTTVMFTMRCPGDGSSAVLMKDRVRSALLERKVKI